jgi:hypothetical protein
VAKQITKTVYTFRELYDKRGESKAAEKAFERARDKLAEWATEDHWYEGVDEQWTEALEQLGFTDAKIAFSGFWSQGDGASFTASVDLDKLIAFFADDITPKDCIEGTPEDFRPWILHKLAKFTTRHNPKFRKLLRVCDYIDCTVERTSSRYSHWNTCRFTADLRDRGEYVGEWGKGYYQSETPRLRALFDDFAQAGEALRINLCGVIYRDLEAEYEHQRSDASLLEMSDANEYTFTEAGQYEPS